MDRERELEQAHLELVDACSECLSSDVLEAIRKVDHSAACQLEAALARWRRASQELVESQR